MQDLLTYATKGLSAVTTQLREEGRRVPDEINRRIVRNLFTTITNVNFDLQSITAQIRETLDAKEALLAQIAHADKLPEAALWTAETSDFPAAAARAGVLATEQEDVRSLRELILYGLKGLAA